MITSDIDYINRASYDERIMYFAFNEDFHLRAVERVTGRAPSFLNANLSAWETMCECLKGFECHA